MTALNFPTSPDTGAVYEAPNNTVYIYDGQKWNVQGTTVTAAASVNFIQDSMAPIFTNIQGTGISFTYDTETNSLSATVSGDGSGLSISDFGEGFSLTAADKIVTNKLYSTNLTQPTQHYRLEVDTNGVVILPDQSIINGATLKTVPGNYAGITAGPAGSTDEDSWVWVDNNGATIATEYSTNAHTWTFNNSGALTFPQGTTIATADGTDAFIIDGAVDKDIQIYTYSGPTAHGWTFGADGVLTLPNNGTINDYVGSAGVLGILIDRTFQTPDNTNSANFGTNTIKLLLSDVEAEEIREYILAGIGVRVWFNQGDSYPITSCVQVSTGVWTVTATGMGNRFTTFAASNTLIFIYTGATPNTYTNFPQYVPVGDGAGITISKGGNSWNFGTDGALTLPSGEPILFGNGNSRIQAGMGFHINSEEGISIEAVDATDPLNPIDRQWHFGINDTLSYPNSAVQRDTATVTCAGNASTVVYTGSAEHQTTIKLLIQVEGNVGAAVDWDTQSCEMIIAKSWRADDVAATVYGIVHTSVAPLATFSAEWNALTSRVEVLCATPSANTVYVRTFATEITTAD